METFRNNDAAAQTAKEGATGTERTAGTVPREESAQALSVFSRCNLPPWKIGAVEFQDDPEWLEIEGVRTMDPRLFARLTGIADEAERGNVFHDYVSVKFRLHEWEQHQASARSSLRHSYVQLLHGWSADSNGRAGAVLKGWVESRFGLRATFHCGRLGEDETARERYWNDRMRGAAGMMGVAMQLDLLYTFCQDELRRQFGGHERWVTLYRGTHDPEEYAVKTDAVPGKASAGPEADLSGEEVVELNCLSSFTSDREVAWEFGSRVWEVRVPLAKVVFFNGLLPRWLLGGESEWLVLGGEYRVRMLRW